MLSRVIMRETALTSWLISLQMAGGARKAPASPGPLIVSGFLNETLGIGRAGKLTVAALRAAGLPLIEHDLRTLKRGMSNSLPPRQDRGGVWLMHCNAPEAIAALAKTRMSEWRSLYRIGYWAYELPKAPARWLRATTFFDEIWTPSTFVAEALRGSRTPVRVMPHPVTVETQLHRPFELQLGKQHVLVAGDLRSSLVRKNVVGAVRIFTAAFPAPTDKVRLVLKLVTRNESSSTLTNLRELIAGRPDVLLVTRDMNDREAQSFVAHSDVLLHPHRSEGFGLMIAEAFLLGTPALATGWSGNMDYMSEARSLLLPAGFSYVTDSDQVYTCNGLRWAEPDLRLAADRLRAVLDDPTHALRDVRLVRKKLQENLGLWSPAQLAEHAFVARLRTPLEQPRETCSA